MKGRDSIIFDLDGTLWDASETVSNAFNESLKEIGYHPLVTPETVRNFSGMKMDDIFAEKFSFVAKDKLADFYHIYAQKEKEYLSKYGGILYPKVEETLQQLSQDYQLFIVSNCMKGYIENFLTFYGFTHFFKDFDCYGNHGYPKNKNIELIVERNHLQRPVYLGDTIWDQESCEKAGVDFIYAAYGFGTIAHPKAKINKFEDLLTIH